MNIAVTLFIILFINFTKRPGSFTEQALLRGPAKKKKTSTTTNKNDNTLETTIKKETKLQKQNWGGHR